jgi:AraC family transcriptional regulator
MIDQKAKTLDYLACIQRSIDYIEENLKSEVTPSGCARAAGFSTYHYYRVFEAYVGIPVMEYVRKRKLAHVLLDLADKRRIIDIAVDFGYGSERTFSRAFKKEYGLSPGEYRKSIDSSTIPVKLVLASFQENNISGGVVMEPKIVTKPAFKVVGYELKTTNRNGQNLKDGPAFWDKYNHNDWRQKLLDHIHPVSKAELGLCFPGDIGVEDFSYIIGMEVADFNGVPAEFFKGEVPAGTWAVFTTPPANIKSDEFVKAIQGTWDYIYKNWFPKSVYEFDGSVKIDFERYDEWYNQELGIQVEIWVPVTKRK